MGFFINESIMLAPYGVTATNVYVTIKGRYAHNKTNFLVDEVPQIKYQATADYHVLVTNDSTLVPIQTGTAVVVEDVPVVDAIEKIYAKIKLDFPGKTFTDDL